MVAADSTFRKVIIHPVAVEIPAPLSHIIVADLDEILGGIYVTEVTESLVVQVLEALAACIIRMPVPNIASKREEDDITRTGQRFDFICPFIGIFTEFTIGIVPMLRCPQLWEAISKPSSRRHWTTFAALARSSSKLKSGCSALYSSVL